MSGARDACTLRASTDMKLTLHTSRIGSWQRNLRSNITIYWLIPTLDGPLGLIKLMRPAIIKVITDAACPCNCAWVILHYINVMIMVMSR